MRRDADTRATAPWTGSHRGRLSDCSAHTLETGCPSCTGPTAASRRVRMEARPARLPGDATGAPLPSAQMPATASRTGGVSGRTVQTAATSPLQIRRPSWKSPARKQVTVRQSEAARRYRLDQVIAGDLRLVQAAKILGIRERRSWRLPAAYRARGTAV